MSIFYQLSKYIALPILCDWLNANELCLVDSATCNKLDRISYLRLIEFENVKLHEMESTEVFQSFLRWVSIRKFHISHLNVGHFLLRENFEKHLSIFIHLKSLHVAHDGLKFKDRFMTLLTVCKQLEYIYLANGRFLNDNVINTISRKCLHLKTMWLGGGYKCSIRVTDAAYVRLSNQCVSLTQMHLANFVHLTDVAIVSVSEKCNGLTSVSLSNLPKVTDNSMFSIATKHPDLTYISVTSCESITAIGLREVLRQCQMLIEVKLDGTPTDLLLIGDCGLQQLCHLTSLTLNYFKLSNGFDYLNFTSNKLQKLSLSDCMAESLTCHTFDCNNLTELNIERCRIEYQELNVILEKCHNSLRVLRVSNVETLNNSTSYRLLGNFHWFMFSENWEVLIVYLNRICITSNCLRTMASRCPRLRILDVSCCLCGSDLSVIPTNITWEDLHVSDCAIHRTNANNFGIESVKKIIPRLKVFKNGRLSE